MTAFVIEATAAAAGGGGFVVLWFCGFVRILGEQQMVGRSIGRGKRCAIVVFGAWFRPERPQKMCRGTFFRFRFSFFLDPQIRAHIECSPLRPSSIVAIYPFLGRRFFSFFYPPAGGYK